MFKGVCVCVCVCACTCVCKYLYVRTDGLKVVPIQDGEGRHHIYGNGRQIYGKLSHLWSIADFILAKTH